MAGLTVEVFEGETPADCVALRTRVFIEEQGVSPSDEIDGLDPDCVHFLAYEGGVVVGCGRLRPLGRERAKVERVAVIASLRGEGRGRAVMDAIEREAGMRGWCALELHAQIQVIAFYEDLGWQGLGGEFEEAGIIHVEMTKRIARSSSSSA